MMSITTTNPATGKTIRTFEPYSAARVNESIDRAVAAYRVHRKSSFTERAVRMRAAASPDKEIKFLGAQVAVDGQRPGGDHGDAVSEHEDRCARAHLPGLEHVGPVCIE